MSRATPKKFAVEMLEPRRLLASDPIGPLFTLTASDADSIDGRGYGHRVEMSADGTTIVGKSGSNAFVERWDSSTNRFEDLRLPDEVDGCEVHIDFDVSADGESIVALGLDGDTNRCLKLFQWIGSEYEGRLIPFSDDGEFGESSLSLSADGTTIVASDFANNGGVHVLRLDGDEVVASMLKRGAPKRNDQYGWSNAVSDDGRTIVVGSPKYADDDSLGGAAFVYRWNGTEYVETKLFDSDVVGGGFGISTAISGDGTTVVVGVYGDSEVASASGAAFIYDWDAATGTYEKTKLVSETATEYAFSGASVAVDRTGMAVVVGGHGDSYGISCGFPDDCPIIEGTASYYRRASKSSEFVETLLVNPHARARDRFGVSVAISDDGETVAVGSPFSSPTSINYQGRDQAGAIYLFHPASESPTAYLFGYIGRDETTNVRGLLFSEPVTGLDVSDFRMTRDGEEENLLTGDEALTTLDGAYYELSGIGFLNATVGDYTLRLNGAGSGIVNAEGVPYEGEAVFRWRINDAPPPGDIDGDGVVDLTDFSILKDRFGAGRGRSKGDFNNDGRVDLRDFVFFKQHFGESQANAAGAAVFAALAAGKDE